MGEYAPKEITAFVEYAGRKEIMQCAKITRHRYELLKNDPLFIEQVNQRRTEIIGNVVRKLESCLASATDELTAIIKDHEIASQTRLNAIRVMFESYARLSDREDILTRLDALEKAQIDQIQP